jgi:hypothetical protein
MVPSPSSSFRAAVVRAAVVLAAIASTQCGGGQTGTGAELANASPAGSAPCSGSGVASAKCPEGAFCMLEGDQGDVFVCKVLPPACKSDVTCDCLIQAGAYDCPSGGWTCEEPVDGAPAVVGCVAD